MTRLGQRTAKDNLSSVFDSTPNHGKAGNELEAEVTEQWDSPEVRCLLISVQARVTEMVDKGEEEQAAVFRGVLWGFLGGRGGAILILEET